MVKGSTAPNSENRPLSLVTGGCGFIGSHLVTLLVGKGHRVRVLDTSPPTTVDPTVEYLGGSILDAALLAFAVDRCDYVFHLAADPNLWHRDKASFDHVNHEGTRRVLAAAGDAGVRRIVHTSTESILMGSRRETEFIDETRVLDVEQVPGAYCRSKLRAEQAALALAREGVPVVVVNPTLPVGPGDRHITPPTRMLIDFLNGRHPALLDFHANLVDVRCVAHGHFLAALHGRVGERYILGGENLLLSEVLARLEALTSFAMPIWRVPYPLALGFAVIAEWISDTISHRPPSATVAGVRLAGASAPFRSDKATRELGWNCRPVDESLVDAVEWLRGHGHLTRSGRPAQD